MINKVLLTGASGFIGSYLTGQLADKGIDFIDISNSIEKAKHPDKTIVLSLSDKEGLIKELGKYKPDAVIHMAAISYAAYEDTGKIYEVNVCGTENLLDAVKAACDSGIRVLLFSSGTVYGNQDRECFTETDPVKPVSHYACSKAAMEFLSRNYDDYMDIRIVRPFNIIGAGQSESFLIPKLISAFKARIPEIKLGNLEAIRDYIDVEFAVSAVAEFLLLDAVDYPVLNICSGTGHSVREVFDTLCRITKHTPAITISDEIVRHNEIWRLVGSAERLNRIMKSGKPAEPEMILEKLVNN